MKSPTLTRIQRSRKPGWKKPEGALYVGRPGIWGNPFVVGYQVPSSYQVFGENFSIHAAISFGDKFTQDDHWNYVVHSKAVPNKETAKRLFAALLADMQETNPTLFKRLLAGLEKADHLMCWCRPEHACHADVWIEMLQQYHSQKQSNFETT